MGSVPDVTEILNGHNPSSATVALGVTHPLTETSTRNRLGIKKAAGT
jgi:hypothetical protein